MAGRDRYLYVAAFAGGLVSLAVELSAASLLRPHFGTANLVWATIIGLVLLYLTAGYFVGGRWADHSPRAELLYQVMLWAAFFIGLVPFVAQPVLRLALRGFAELNAALIGGSFVSVLVLFSVPVTLLGCISPFVIRLAVEDVGSAGSTAGRVYAVSTAGSFLGAFLPDLVLVPIIGTRNTFVSLSLLLSVVALVGLARSRSRRLLPYLALPVVIVVLAVALRGQPVKASSGAVYETESAYNYIQVVEVEGGCRHLLLNEGQAIHSIYCPGDLTTPGPWDYFLIAPYFNAPPHVPAQVQSMALVGLAGGTMARQYDAAYGPIPVDGIEIDPRIVEVGRKYFGMDFPGLNVVVADGRFYLARSERAYSVVGIDAFRLPYIPPHLTTVEFFSLVRDHLTDDGTVVLNVGKTPRDFRLVDAIGATLLEVFPSVYVIDVPGSYNAVVVATLQPTEVGNLAANLPGLEGNDLLYGSAMRAIDNLLPLRPGGVVFTDDRAAIELMTNLLIIDYILEWLA
jgi:predicted membrane-bound spermidine synthase